MHPLSAVVVQQVAEDYINGNISDVKKAISGMKDFNAAYLGVAVFFILPNDKKISFLRLLAEWGN